jgi:hypothetical protein
MQSLKKSLKKSFLQDIFSFFSSGVIDTPGIVVMAIILRMEKVIKSLVKLIVFSQEKIMTGVLSLIFESRKK